jgi:hypothetical protein
MDEIHRDQAIHQVEHCFHQLTNLLDGLEKLVVHHHQAALRWQLQAVRYWMPVEHLPERHSSEED